MLLSQPAVPCVAAGAQEGPHDDGLVNSPDTSAAGPQDQQHVLERFVGTHFTHITNHQHCLHLLDEWPYR